MKNHAPFKTTFAVGLLFAATILLVHAQGTNFTWVGTDPGGSNILGVANNWTNTVLGISRLPSPAGAGDTGTWDGVVSGPLSLIYSNASGLQGAGGAGQWGLTLRVTSNQTSSLIIDGATAGSPPINTIRLNKILVDSGAGTVTFSRSSTTYLDLLWGQPGAPSPGQGNAPYIHTNVNNSANPVIINTNVTFRYGGNTPHLLLMGGSGDWFINKYMTTLNAAGDGAPVAIRMYVNGTGRVVLAPSGDSASVSGPGTVGDISVRSGTLVLGDNNALQNANALLYMSGGNLDATNQDFVNAFQDPPNQQIWSNNFAFIGTKNADMGSFDPQFSPPGGTITMAGNITVTVLSNTLSIGGPIVGGFSLTKAGNGTLRLYVPSPSANTYTGNTTINEGTLKVDGDSNGVLPGGPVTVNGRLDLNGRNLAINALSGTGVVDTVSGGSPTLTVNPNGTSSATFNGTIRNSAGTLALTLSGGTLTLNGTNTYSGATSVNAGTMVVNGSIGAGNVTVASGARLSGTGTIGGNVTFNSGALVTFTAGSPLTVSGSLTLDNNSVTVFVPGTPLAPGTYTLMTYNPSGSSGSFNSTPTYTGAGAAGGTASSISTAGGLVTLSVTVAGTSATWINDADGNWTTAANWSSNPTVPGAPGDLVWLGVGSALRTVTLDANETVGSINFTNPNSFVVANAGNTLTFDNNGSGAAVTVGAGSANAIATAVKLSDNTTFSVISPNTLSVSGTITSSAATNTLAFGGGGTLVVSGNNSYGPSAGTVGTTLSGGTLRLGHNNALAAGDVSVAGSTTIRADTALTLANNMTIASGATANINDNGNNTTLSGVISGAGGLGTTGSAVVALTSANTYSGFTTVNGGTLRLGVVNALPTTVVTVNGRLDLNGFSPTLGGLQGSGTVDSLTGGAVALTVGADNSFSTFNGTITNSTGPLSLTKTGTGNFSLAGTNSFSGSITNQSGTLRIIFGNGMLNGGTIAQNINNSATLVFTSSVPHTVTGVISGSGGLEQRGPGVLTLAATNTYSGQTTIGANSTLAIANDSALGSGAVFFTPPATIQSADGSARVITNQYIPGNTMNVGGTGTMTFTAPLAFDGNNRSFVINNPVTRLSGPLSSSGGGVNVGSTLFGGSGVLILSGTNTYSGNTTVLFGTLKLGSPFAISTGTLAMNGGYLDSDVPNLVNANNNPQTWFANVTFVGSENLDLGTGPVGMTAARTVTISNNTLTIGGVISGGFVLTKDGAGTLALTGANTFSGGLTIANGTVAAGNNDALGSGPLTFSGPGAVIRSTDATARSFTNNLSFGGGNNDMNVAGTGNLSFSGALVPSFNFTKTFIINNPVTTLAGPIPAGAGGLIKAGAGTLVLTATNAYTGATAVNTGTLAVSGDGVISNSATITVAGSATLDVSGHTGGGITLEAGQTLAGNGSVIGNVTMADGSTLSPGTSAGTLTVNGDLVLNGATTLAYELGTNSDRTVVNGNLTLDGTVNVANAGGLAAGDFILISYTGSLVDNGLNVGTLPGGFSGVVSNDLVNKRVVLAVSGGGDPFATWQNQYFGCTGCPQAAGGADPDGDGMINTNEFLAGFNPTNSAAYLRIISVTRSGSDINVTYLGANGDSAGSPGPKTNVLEFTTGTGTGSYTNNFASTGLTNILSGGVGLGTNITVTDIFGATNAPARYYRVRVLAP
jgi:fibronectin-binding autotransporter adhesin